MTGPAKESVVATGVRPERGLVSRMGDGLRGLVQPRNARVEDGIGTARSLRETDGKFGAARYPMDAGITGGISLLFGNPDDGTSP